MEANWCAIEFERIPGLSESIETTRNVPRIGMKAGKNCSKIWNAAWSWERSNFALSAFFSLPIAKGSGNAVMWHEIGTKTRQEPGKQPTTTFRIVNERRNPRSHFDSVSSFSSHSRSTTNRRTAEVKRLKNFIIVSVEKFLEHLWHNFFPWICGVNLH